MSLTSPSLGDLSGHAMTPFVDWRLNPGGLGTPCVLIYLYCPSRGPGRLLSLHPSLSLSPSLSPSLPHPFSLSQSLTHTLSVSLSIFSAASGAGSGAAERGAALLYHPQKLTICRRGRHANILYESTINTIRKPDAWSGQGVELG